MSSAVGKNSTSKIAGFTLIELVVVIIVISVLAAVAIPKFSSKSGFEDYTVQDQLIARLRLVQLQAMNADPTTDVTENACYWLVVKSNCFYHEHTTKNGNDCNLPSAADVCASDDYNQYNSVTFPTGMLAPNNYRFDLQGRLATGASPITITGDNSLSVTIESEGYVHE